MSGFEERDCIVATQPLISLKRYGHKNADSVARVKIFSSFKISGVCRVFDSVQVKSPCREQKRDCIFEMHPFVVKQTAHFLLIKKKKTFSCNHKRWPGDWNGSLSSDIFWLHQKIGCFCPSQQVSWWFSRFLSHQINKCRSSDEFLSSWLLVVLNKCTGWGDNLCWKVTDTNLSFSQKLLH